MSFFSFLLGVGTGFVVLSNGPKVRRTIARAAVLGADAAMAAGKEAQRISARMAEDFQDALAEVRAEEAQKKAEAEALEELREQVRQMKAESEAFRARAEGTKVQ